MTWLIYKPWCEKTCFDLVRNPKDSFSQQNLKSAGHIHMMLISFVVCSVDTSSFYFQNERQHEKICFLYMEKQRRS